MFRHLITVGGVGPKRGMAILSAIPAQTIAGAILNEDPALLTSAPGVGKRTAERIILELKNKLPEHLAARSEEHTSELQSRGHLVCRLLLENKNCVYLRCMR